MTEKRLSIKLTSEQQKQVKDATGKTVTTLNIDLASLSDEELEQVTGGHSTGGGSQGVRSQS